MFIVVSFFFMVVYRDLRVRLAVTGELLANFSMDRSGPKLLALFRCSGVMLRWSACVRMVTHPPIQFGCKLSPKMPTSTSLHFATGEA
jgi:hypothetical protein